MSDPNFKEKYTSDIIIILDHSGSMKSMGNEPIQSINAFLKEQKNNCIEDGSTFTLVIFDNKYRVITDHIPIKDVDDILESTYNPTGGTALNDAICFTITKELELHNTDNKIVLIITDGEENSSQTFSSVDTRNMVSDCREKHNWEFIFIGANIDAFSSGNNINIKKTQCAQFSQQVPGDLLQMCRQVSYEIGSIRRVRTEGSSTAPQSINISAPINIPKPNNIKGYGIIPIMRSKAVPIEILMYPFFGGNCVPSPVDDLIEIPDIKMRRHSTEY
jgi:uncharacterized protein YegL